MRRNPAACAAMLALSFTGFEAGAVTACDAGISNAAAPVATPTSAFVINGDGTATHALTGLTWNRCPQGLSGAACDVGALAPMTWQDALKASATDTTAGYGDWRLPNKKELESIVETCGNGPAINRVVFPATPGANFWTSSTDVQTPANHWAVDFGLGHSWAKPTQAYPVRLVRGGRTFATFDARTALGCTLDIDGNGKVDALTDALLFIRALFGLTGTSVTNGALGVGATRTDWEKLRTFMNDRCGTNFAP